MAFAGTHFEFTVTDFPGGDKSFVELPFSVPETIERIEVSYAFSSGSVIDLGLARNGRMRGWSGSERGHVTVEGDAATPGYDAGTVPGDWHVVLGIVKVIEGARVDVTVRLIERKARWFVGELHSHSEHSDGGVTVLDAIYRARQGGLDFVSITDHNTISQNIIRPDDPAILVFPAMELTTYWGHTNFHGLVKPVADWRCRTPAEVGEKMVEAKANGATIVINHPFQRSAGGKWQAGFDVPFDALEIWNGNWAPHNIDALAFWQELLVSGKRIPATGGSDFHQKNRRRHGRPSNRLYAEARTMADLLAAVRAGHNVVSFSADDLTTEPVDASLPMFGDGAASGSKLAIRFDGLVSGDEIRVVTDAGVVSQQAVTAGSEIVEARLDGRFVRFEVWHGETPKLFTNPVYAD